MLITWAMSITRAEHVQADKVSISSWLTNLLFIQGPGTAKVELAIMLNLNCQVEDHSKTSKLWNILGRSGLLLSSEDNSNWVSRVCCKTLLWGPP